MSGCFFDIIIIIGFFGIFKQLVFVLTGVKYSGVAQGDNFYSGQQ